ncbi:DUF3618 domain-containing protein [Frankia sp. AgKG'84/4]
MPQDPAVIQRQIEETRAELAETIDAISEIVSPRRIAERTQDQLRVRAAELRARYGPALGLGPGPGRPELAAGDGEGPAVRDGTLPSALSTGAGAGGATAALVRVVRWDRVALVGGGLLLVAGGMRRRRRASRR